ncbi:LysR family transcriptional regulator [Orbus mooreae]|uniref:LysR family transcriptional regulator n=1 Tax=Orbus mooreae TaxID=3074107 RepID=UPI00370DC183
MKLDLNCLPIFIAVIEHGNFSAAAQKLHLTRSAVSKSISRLEQSLGVSLFQRTTRHQILTDEGVTFYEYSCKALESITDVQSYLESGKVCVKGKVSITLPQLLGSLYITPLLVDLMANYPDLEIEIILNDNIIDLHREGIQVAVRVGEIRDSSQFIAHQIGNHRMILCASPSYLITRDKPCTIEQLQNHCLIAYTQSGKVMPWHLYTAEKKKLSIYQIVG